MARLIPKCSHGYHPNLVALLAPQWPLKAPGHLNMEAPRSPWWPPATHSGNHELLGVTMGCWGPKLLIVAPSSPLVAPHWPMVAPNSSLWPPRDPEWPQEPTVAPQLLMVAPRSPRQPLSHPRRLPAVQGGPQWPMVAPQWFMVAPSSPLVASHWPMLAPSSLRWPPRGP